jgi:6-phosphogluconolactonase (cycloisomerase 2 family)
VTALYASVGEVLTRYELDVDGAALARRESVALPQNVQYAWPHPSRRFFYVASSNRSGASPGNSHWLSAFRVDPASGALAPHGEALALAHRPVHMSLDVTGAHALVAYNLPAGISVHRIGDDGRIGAPVSPAGALDTGIFAHQVRAVPSNRQVILVTRGNDAAGGKPEDPGALKVYGYQEGVLSGQASVAPGKGYGFGPRHLDFHPTRPWAYVAIERQNQLQTFRLESGGLAAAPAYTKDTLADRGKLRPRQLVGAIHVHPNGKFVYVSNRSDNTVDHEGTKVFGGGENSIAVFAIDGESGEPTLIQHADPQSYHVRTFALDPSGKVLVAASISPMDVREAGRIVHVPAALSVFRVGADGRLAFVRKYDVETNGRMQWWAGIA